MDNCVDTAGEKSEVLRVPIMQTCAWLSGLMRPLIYTAVSPGSDKCACCRM